MKESYAPLSALDKEQFDLFIRQEGYTLDGQMQRLHSMRRFVEERMERQESDRRKALAAHGMSDPAIDETVRREFQPVRYETIEKDGQIVAVIAEKSSLPPEVRADYTVMIPAHVDTITPDWPSFRANDLNTRVDQQSGRIVSVGVFDEGQAVLNGIAVLADVRVPPGMRVYGVFTRGEETPQSVGAVEVLHQWQSMRDVDLVLSSEIGPLPQDAIPKAGDTAMRYIVARPGRARLFATFKVTDSARGHASIPDLPNPQEERDRFAVALMDIFTGENPHGFRYGNDSRTGLPRTSLQRSHLLFDQERIDMGDVWYPDKNRSGEHGDVQGRDMAYVHQPVVHSKFYVRMVPPRTVQQVLEEVQAIHRHIGTLRQWARRGILSKVEIFTGEESYPPFAMLSHTEHAAVRIVHDMLTNVGGSEAVPTRGESVADENLYANGGSRLVLSIPAHGGHAHSPHEWVSADDIARVRHVFMRLLQDPDGLSQLMTKSR